MQAVILAAGKGTRLHPVSAMRSKAMAPVAGRPMVEWVLTSLRSAGVCDVILVVSEDDADIRRHFSARSVTDRSVQFVVQTERLGMAHALGLAAGLLDGDFVLTACDSVTPETHVAALVAAHRRRNAAATLSLMEVTPDRFAKTGIVDWRGERVVGIVEKPHPDDAPSNISSLPLYVFSPEILPLLATVQPSERGEYELQDAIQMLVDGQALVTGVFTSERRQLTTVADLLALNRYYLRTAGGQSNGVPVDVSIETPVWIAPDVRLGAGATVGPDVMLEAGCEVGAGASLRNTIALAGSRIAPGRRVVDRVITPAHT